MCSSLNRLGFRSHLKLAEKIKKARYRT